ncbi:hypothetical protein [Robertmurraya sp. FSL R5-0851]|uniref:hypothetical protein n=1 Tax=Robertmurraya sp. FSL R5-0851 TaxID=2921584 RepID=UPI0030FCC761
MNKIKKCRFNMKKVKVKLYLAGNEFAATAKDELFFVDKCYANTPEMAKEIALEKIQQYYLDDIQLQNKYKNKDSIKDIAR